jgi:hypothetical protein
MAWYGLDMVWRRAGTAAQWRKAAQPAGGCVRSTWHRPRGLPAFRTVTRARRTNQRSQARLGVHVRWGTATGRCGWVRHGAGDVARSCVLALEQFDVALFDCSFLKIFELKWAEC